ncbi:hypothetical protein GON03_22705 [Nocardioides sp. MAH-18]|uniref:Mycothiol-dependent maleylpyruvate isomerase metal-binding domain-containing protein n=1 Tax=Nocardioides agri TaxID=2682843 RepID=A0A6L6XX72_9ACTN|nr:MULTISPECIES: maleylpyruvate isomerase N-terminal domain-containing protein [unclassified Nocardioides]MBA2952839.1 maleylpyruvate isomerase N-terminal domain-containing protein [Nocardioides sp. CGMCC 1.13656]MVQ52001.1 hypothetical protein [Nocardioides sp. MAH-18]
MSLVVELEVGRRAFSESVEAFLRAVDGFDEHALLGASRCHGWTRLDVVVHTISGWHEMLGGMVSVVDDEPTVDAASYWTSFAEEYAGADPVDVLMVQRRRTAAYRRPALACEELRDVAGMVLRGAAGMTEVHHFWQQQVFTAGDYLAVWAVEDAVHHLDLLADEPVPAGALDLTRATVEALAGAFPEDWTAEDVALVGTGRRPAPEGLGATVDRLPAFA